MLSVGAAVSAQAAGRQVYDDAGLFSDSEISELQQLLMWQRKKPDGILCF